MSLLTKACKRRLIDYDVINFILSKENNINYQDKQGMTALHYVCSHRRIDLKILNLLLECGADINIKDNSGNNPLMHVCNSIVRTKDLNSVLVAIKTLIDVGSNVNDNNVYGGFPLLYVATRTINLEVIRVLIEEGANVNLKSNNGTSVLMNVCQYGYNFLKINTIEIYNVIQFLIDAGANINDINENHETVLHHVCLNADPDPSWIQLLLENGADRNMRNAQGYTPLNLYHLNHGRCDAEIINLLSDY